MDTTHVTSPPNHHAGQGGFSGLAGLLVAASMAVGRGRDAAWAIDLARPAPGSTIVDIGCGPGQAVRIAARRGWNAIGVDPSAQMLRVARWFDRSRRSTYLEGAAEAMPVGDAVAGACWSIASVHHWTDVPAGLAEVHRILAPGTRFVAIERSVAAGATGHASHGWSDAQAEAFADMCRAAGFESVTIERSHTRRRQRVAVTSQV